MNILFLNIETLPDIQGARQLYHLPDDLADKDVAKIIFHHHMHREGRDSRFLRPFQAAISQVALLSVRDDVPAVEILEAGDKGEPRLLRRLGERIRRHDTKVVFWDEGRDVDALIKVRSLIHSVVLDHSSLTSIENQLGLTAGDIGIDQLANRLGIAVEPVASDEMLWTAWRKQGAEAVRRRCRTNLSATVQIGLRHLYTAGELDSDAYAEISNACSNLCKEES